MKTTIARAALFGALSLALVLTAIPAAYAGPTSTDRNLKSYTSEGLGWQGANWHAEGLGWQGITSHAEGFGWQGATSHIDGVRSLPRRAAHRGDLSAFAPSISDFLLRLFYLH